MCLFELVTRSKPFTQVYAWPILRTIFTEVLGRNEWLILWDHLFAWSNEPQMLLVAVVAYLVYHRSTIMGMKNTIEMERWVHVGHAINMRRFIDTVWTQSRNPTAALFTDDALLPSHAEDEFAIHLHETPWPIQQGSYPSFLDYPKFVVDFNIAERQRIEVEETGLLKKQGPWAGRVGICLRH